MSRDFNINCKKCPRLVAYLKQVRRVYPDYHNRPVPAIGSIKPQLLIVGLAPGKHGANATGKPFTGDYSGELLYKALNAMGFCDSFEEKNSYGIRLINCRITNAVKCLPPENRPTASEIRHCNGYLASEIKALKPRPVVLALGGIAHNAVLMATGNRRSDHKFAHAAVHELDDLMLIDSYHCSRYNVQTKRLTEVMFLAVFDRVAEMMKAD